MTAFSVLTFHWVLIESRCLHSTLYRLWPTSASRSSVYNSFPTIIRGKIKGCWQQFIDTLFVHPGKLEVGLPQGNGRLNVSRPSVWWLVLPVTPELGPWWKSSKFIVGQSCLVVGRSGHHHWATSNNSLDQGSLGQCAIALFLVPSGTFRPLWLGRI